MLLGWDWEMESQASIEKKDDQLKHKISNSNMTLYETIHKPTHMKITAACVVMQLWNCKHSHGIEFQWGMEFLL